MPARLESLARKRLEKLERLRSRGIDPYPPRYHRSHTAEQAIALFQEKEAQGTPSPPCSLAGRVTAQRIMGKATFLDLRDGTGKIQAYLRSDTPGVDYPLWKELDIGDIVGVTGHLFRTHSGEITVQVSQFSLLSKALLPLPEKWHGLVDVEKRYRQRYLDLIANQEVQQVFLMRSRLISSLRRFMDGRGFIEVETPVLQALAGGAAARPFVTHHQALGRDLYLRIATELHLKRLIVGGLDKVYEIGRVFRNEGISTRHNPEFTTLESYEAYADYQDVMQMVEEMVCFLAREVLGSLQLRYAGQTIDLTPPGPASP